MITSCSQIDNQTRGKQVRYKKCNNRERKTHVSLTEKKALRMIQNILQIMSRFSSLFVSIYALPFYFMPCNFTQSACLISWHLYYIST